ncbi:hypothetical protein TNCV_1940251 [Trichonephila clavipes]|nr:hypothetical protein TNCV_1940251 [Trichonephila clavipes]
MGREDVPQSTKRSFEAERRRGEGKESGTAEGSESRRMPQWKEGEILQRLLDSDPSVAHHQTKTRSFVELIEI